MAKTGHGQAYGAATIVNATATGIGCSLAVNARTVVTWTPQDAHGDGRLTVSGAPDLRLVEAVAHELGADRGALVSISCPLPAGRGLKTSSTVAAALVRAVLDADGHAFAEPDEVERLAVAACRRAQVTLTGALDDQMAAVRGGCHVVDTRSGRRLAEPVASPWQVAIWVPEASIDKSVVAGVDVSAARDEVAQAVELARAGRLPEAMTLNGRAFHAAYSAAGLPVDDLPTRVALAKGALGAGLSGTGPAVAALFDRRVQLPPVRGGTWQWTRTVPTMTAAPPPTASGPTVSVL